MAERTAIVNISGDHEETILRLSVHLGASKIRRKVFNAIYGRGSRPKSKKQIMKLARIPNKGTSGQQVQNELDHLSKHHLIMRSENRGLVNDGSRFLYSKDPTVRANRDQIVKYADNKRLASRVPTKRTPKLVVNTVVRTVTKTALRRRKRLSVLYLTANPGSSAKLRLDGEVMKVQNEIRGSKFRDSVAFEFRPAASLKSLIDGLNDVRPQIVQFSGHGDRAGIEADDGSDSGRPQFLPFTLLAQALAATDTPPQVAVLNSCSSAGARKSLLGRKSGSTKIVIAMKSAVGDLAAIAFATQFYAGLASGQSVQAAFNQGKVAVSAVALSEAETPVLLCRAGVDPSALILT